METQNEVKTLRQEDMTPEQLEAWLTFYRTAMQRKRETLEEMREFRKTPEYKEMTERLDKRNAERGTPYL